MTVKLGRRGEEFVPRAELQREIGTDPPIVADVGDGAPASKVGAGSSKALVGGVGLAKQEVREIQARTGNGLPVGADQSRLQAAEGEQAFGRLVGIRIVIDAPNFSAKRHRLL